MAEMTTGLWILTAVVSAAVMAIGSRRAVVHAAAVAEAIRVPPFLVGMTLVAIGTDIPEIVNSVVAAWSGHGDITLGDATGSVFTQITLGLGLFPFAAGVIIVGRRNVWLLSALTVAGLALGVALYSDGGISRADAVALLAFWLASTVAAWRFRGPTIAPSPRGARSGRRPAWDALAALGSLTVVGGASAVLVGAIAALASAAGIPEYVMSFFAAAVATSLPEIAVELAALRRGERQLALGDVFGSCLVDASLAVAIGPLLFPTDVTPALAWRGAVFAATAMVIAGVVLGARRTHDRRSGALLLICYLAAYWVTAAGGH